MDKYGLIGYPLRHSLSSDYFNAKFQAEAIDAEYINFEIPSIELLPAVLTDNPELRGFNVTIPYKEKIIPYLDALDPAAREIGAVNVVKIIRRPGQKAQLKGYNSDYIGFKTSIEPLLDEHHRRALVLGTGGACKAICKGLEDLGIMPATVSRTFGKGMMTYDEITPDTMREFKVIINCTPVGMYPYIGDCPRIDYELLTPGHLLFDLIYNPDETLFMKKGAQKGATVKNGMEMLLLQALSAWEIWQG